MDDKHRFITLNCSHCGNVLRVQVGCGERTCPICRKKWFGYHYKTVLECITAWPRIYFMTLTIKNLDGQIYRSDITKLRKDFGKLREHYTKRKKGSREIISQKIKGGFYIIQATNRGRGWHPHLHVLYDGSYIAKESLALAWANITSGSYVVDIRVAETAARGLKYLLSDFLQSPRIRPEDYAEYNGIFKGQRIIQPFGTYKNIKFRKSYACPICGCECWLELNDFLHKDRIARRVYYDEVDSS
jgi:hypothetical protein